jgi:HK97 family phage prohead protease
MSKSPTLNPTSARTNVAARLVATRVFERPWAITDSGLELMLQIAEITAVPQSAHSEYDDSDNDPGNTYKVTRGVAVIPVEGPLFKNSSYLTRYLGFATYEDIKRKIGHALVNPMVRGIVLDIDSPGGESAGCNDLSDFVYLARSIKPIFSISNDSMYSAAFWIGSAASRVFVTRDAGCGSVGVYILHMDRSGADAQAGVNFTYIQSGLYKTDGNPHEPLSESAEAVLQNEVDRCRDAFVASVARNRNCEPQEIYETEAGVRFADGNIPLLADHLGNLEDCIRALITHCGGDPDDDIGSDFLGDYLSSESTSTTDATASSFLDVRNELERSVLGRMVASPPAGYILAQPGVSYPERSNTCIPVVRRSAVNVTGTNDSRMISMLVIPYGALSTDLGGFRESYAIGCFENGLDQDPRVLINHDERLIIGRQSALNAKFFQTPVGVRVDVDVPETTYGNDLLTLVRQKIIRESSAAFWILKYHWESRHGERIRIVDRAMLREASPVTFAAYPSATTTLV